MRFDDVFNKNSLWEDVTCPICRSSRFLIKYRDITSWEYKGVYHLVRCSNCGLVFQNPRIKDIYNYLYYQSDDYWRVNLRSKKIYDYEYIYKRYQTRKTGSIYDIGCGTGKFLSWFLRKGWDVLGSDISRKPLDYAKKHFGINVKKGDLLSIDFKEAKFDLISMVHVFEHLYKPIESLKKITKLLKDDGELIITIPNHNSLGRIFFGANWFQYQPGRHLYYYAPDTVKLILAKCGFEIKNIDHWTKVDSLYSVFQSLRYIFSPKFKKSAHGGLVSGSPKEARRKLKKSLGYEYFKLFASLFSRFIFIVEYCLDLSDVVTIYAKKKV